MRTSVFVGDNDSFGAASINVSAGSMNIGGFLVARINPGDGVAFDLENVFVHANNDIIVGNQMFVGGSVSGWRKH